MPMSNMDEYQVYQNAAGALEVRFDAKNDTVWLRQEQLAQLFGRERSVITKHLRKAFAEEELDEKSNVQILHISGSDRPIKFYNLDVIISVGYRVKSLQGTRFRQWASTRLKEYLIKGFTMNDELLKQNGGGNYFEELLARIRDIRSSEKVFWRKVLDIYATSIDYDPKSESSILFFQTIQNKMHWAAHGHTAAEIIYHRIDATKPNLGLTTFKGKKPTQQETEIAKNYLNEDELNLLNRMVTAYLELAELQALNRKPMYMNDWIARLDDFLQMTGNTILDHAGSISHEKAVEKAKNEYQKFKATSLQQPTTAEEDFLKYIELTAKKLNNDK